MRPQKQKRRRAPQKRNQLSNFVPVPPYRINLRFTCEPATDCTSITGLNPKNLGLCVGVAFLNVSEYIIPANGVLAPTAVSAIPFRYMNVRKARVWGPTSGSIKIVVNADASTLVFPRPTKIAESSSVVSRPYDQIAAPPKTPIILNTNTLNVTSTFLVTFVKGTVAGCDNTVILEFDCIVYS